MGKRIAIGKIFLFTILFVWANGGTVQAINLVNFGESSSANTFGLPGWSTVLLSDNMVYTSLGDGGVVCSVDPEGYGEFRGVSGSSHDFIMGERIVVTWYNNSDETFNFTARVSFTDDDAPSEESPDGNWYTMRSFTDYRYTYTEIQPYTFAKTVFNITDTGVHATVGTFSLVNISVVIEWGSTYQMPFMICDKIELLDDADITPPTVPSNVVATALSDSKVRLSWTPSTDNVGVVDYMIYMDDAVEGYVRSPEFTCVFLEPATSYTFTITARDAVQNESAPSAVVTVQTQPYSGSGTLINPAGLEYLGAVAMPMDFWWGSEAIAYYPDGDGGQANTDDGFPGSMFVTNVNQPENGLVGESSIPPPVISAQPSIDDLNVGTLLSPPVNIRPSNIDSWDFVDIWRTGLEYVPDEERLYSTWSIHYTVTGEKHASVSCTDVTNLGGSTHYGGWYLGDAATPPIDAMASDYLFSLPHAWANANCSGRNLVSGRFRDGGLSGLGPTLYAFSPVGDSPPAPNSELDYTTLLEYGSFEAIIDNYEFPDAIDGFKLNDEWREAMWLTAGSQSAVAMVGMKGLGHNWYGYIDEPMPLDWVVADVPHPDFPLGKCWRSHNRQPMIILYDPADLAAVANGQINSYDPQPYAAVRIPKNKLFGNPFYPEIFSAAFDAINRLLYVTEFVADHDGTPVLHVWRVDEVESTGIEDDANVTQNESFLGHNYPNPVNDRTTIHWSQPWASLVLINIYNVSGQLIKMLTKESYDVGDHSISWDGKDSNGLDVGSGIYFYQLNVGDQTETKKMVLIH